jgi:hypothetical protein
MVQSSDPPVTAFPDFRLFLSKSQAKSGLKVDGFFSLNTFSRDCSLQVNLQYFRGISGNVFDKIFGQFLAAKRVVIDEGRRKKKKLMSVSLDRSR